MEYKFTEIEEKWKKFWTDNNIYKVTEDSAKPKYYVLDMFPYPSGAGLHVGHPLGYVASDIYARYKRMKGFNVLHPMGYDAFGLPAEQYAIETGTHPAITTEKAIKRYREQMDKIGFSFDWSREVRTNDPDFYKWTQWIFLKLFNSWFNKETNKAESIDTLIKKFETGAFKSEIRNPKSEIVEWENLSEAAKQKTLMNYRLAFQSYSEVNWCPALGTVLANDEVKDGKSERGGYPVERKKMRQWFLRITEYADRLLEGLDKLDWSESMKEMQRNWIGRSEGALVKFRISDFGMRNENAGLEVFTTRPDTIFGATFMVIAAEHELVSDLTTAEQKQEVEKYIAYVKSRTDVERQQEKKITGVFTGSYAVNPFTGTNIPIYIAEYVLAGYGTGAIMAVPADDERDLKFAQKFNLPVVDIIDKSMHPGATIEDKVGKMINSEFLNGLEVLDAIKKINDEIEKRGIGKRKINYKLHDAGFSRQRYWGEPFPIKYKVVGKPDPPFEGDGETDDIPYPIDESELPLILPEVSSYKPAGDGRAPLANNADWVKAGYETDTMPGYAGSSWYYLRYMDANNKNEFAAKDKLDYWQNVDLYLGGSEHAVGHLLYARFWHKFLYDLGYVNTAEPFKKLVNQGMIQGRSSFVYRLDRSYFKPAHAGEIIENAPNIYVTKEIAEQIISYKETDSISEEVDLLLKKNIDTAQSVFQYLLDSLPIDLPSNASDSNTEEEKENFKKYLKQNRYDSTLQFSYEVSKLHVDVGLVNGDILDIETAKKTRPFSENDIFITNKNGEYVCDHEIEKMSKSKLNVISPDRRKLNDDDEIDIQGVIEKHGADCFRMFEMFLGPIEQSKPWDDKGISGVSNFLRKFWRLFYEDAKTPGGDSPFRGQGAEEPTDAELKVLHKTLKKVAEDIEKLNFNTAVSAFMICVNELGTLNCHKRKILEPLVIALAPFAPFITEELWSALGNTGSVHHAAFPAIEEKYLVENTHTYPVSINGKVRAQVNLALDLTQQDVEKQILEMDIIKKWTNGNPPKKFIFVKGKIINVVV